MNFRSYFSDSKVEAQDEKNKTSPINEITNNKPEQTNNKPTNKQTEKQFAQVSQDMSELVYHLNSIQNDISELAGRPISLTKIED